MDGCLIDAKGLAKRLSVTVRTVRQWDVEKKLPTPLRIGRTVRWSSDSIDAWLSSGCPTQSGDAAKSEGGDAHE